MSFQCLELLNGTCCKGAAESSAQIPTQDRSFPSASSTSGGFLGQK